MPHASRRGHATHVCDAEMLATLRATAAPTHSKTTRLVYTLVTYYWRVVALYILVLRSTTQVHMLVVLVTRRVHGTHATRSATRYIRLSARATPDRVLI
jgi:hypothetical protein